MADISTTATPAHWSDRILDFQNSGLSRKDWCLQNNVPLSTLNYWIRKCRAENNTEQLSSEPVFAKLPSQQELCFQMEGASSPVVIRIPGNIRIEVSADCPERLLVPILQILKAYA